MPVVFPVDQEDVLELILPMIQSYRAKRATMVDEEADAFQTLVGDDTKTLLKTRLMPLIGINEVSQGFDSAYQQCAKEILEVGKLWKNWSGDISELYLWNSVTIAPFRDEKSRAISFDELSYQFNSEGVTMTIHPPFVDRFGIGVGKFKTDLDVNSPFRFDLPLLAPPGVSAEEISSELEGLILPMAEAQRGMALEIVGKDLAQWLIESMLIHEIQHGYFAGEVSPVIVNGLARVHLFSSIRKTYEGGIEKLLPQLMYFSLPDDGTDPAEFLSQLETIDPLDAVGPEFEEAASRVFMFGLLKAAQKTGHDKPPLLVFKRLEIATPDGGYDQRSFIKELRKIYPDLDWGIKAARSELVDMMKEAFVPPQSEVETERFRMPESYVEMPFSSLNFTYPRKLSNAVSKIAPEWAKNLEGARSKIENRYGKRNYSDPVEILDADLVSLRRYGIKVDRKAAEMWALQTALIENIDHFLVGFYEMNSVQIWFKEDLKSMLSSGVEVPGFSYQKASDKVTFEFNFSIAHSEKTSVKEVVEETAKSANRYFPVVLEREKLEGKSDEESAAAIRDGDVLLSKLCQAAETISPKALVGRDVQVFSDAEAFFLVVHELFESELVRSYIGSPDRRWFCDGLSNVVAILECDRRFGAGKGLEVFERFFPPEKGRRLMDKVDLLNWKAVGDEDELIAEVDGVVSAHYYFSTMVLLKALEDQESDFIAAWLAEISQTNWVRTNSETVMGSYDALTGEAGKLRAMVTDVSLTQ